MQRVVVLLTMLVALGQPVAEAIACERHHTGPTTACHSTTPPPGHPDAAHHGSPESTPPGGHDGCSGMLSCTAGVPAVQPRLASFAPPLPVQVEPTVAVADAALPGAAQLAFHPPRS